MYLDVPGTKADFSYWGLSSVPSRRGVLPFVGLARPLGLLVQ